MATCGTGGWIGPLPGDPDNNSILTATAVYGGIQVAWTYPTLNAEAVAHVELYRGITTNFAEAPLYRIVTGNAYFDAYNGTDQLFYYYWIRIVSVYGTQGDPIGPAYAVAGSYVLALLGLLEGQLGESALVTSLRSKVDNILTVENNLISEIAARLLDNASLAAVMTGLQASTDEVATFLVTETTQRTTADSAQVTATNAIAARLAASGDVGSALIVAQNTATTAVDDAATALAAANAAGRPIYYAMAAPTGAEVGALWVDVSNENQIHRWDGFAWINIADTRIVSTAETVTLLQATVDSPSTGLSTKASVGYVDTAKSDAITASATASSALVATAVNNAAIDATTKADAAQTTSLAAVTNEATARANADTALSNSVSTLQTTVGGNTTSIQTTSTTVDGIQGKHTVKIDNNGYVTGYGLISTANNGIPTSEFAIVADKFSIAPVASDPNAADGSPFFHLTVPTVIAGITIPAGTYMKAAHIHEATITSAKIADAAITNAKIAGVIQSSDYSAGLAGWKIDKAGEMEMNTGSFRGSITGASGTFTGGLDVKSAASGARMEIKGNVIKVFDLAGTLRVRIGDLTA